MRCADARASLSARLDDELTFSEVGELIAHLDRCPGCVAYDGRLDALRRRLRVGSPTTTRAADPVDRVVAAVVADPGRRRRPRSFGRHATGRRALRASAVAASVLVVALTVAVAARDRDEALVTTGPAVLAPATGESLLLVWTSGGIADGLATGAARLPGVHAVVTVRGDVVDLDVDVERGLLAPVDILAVEPRALARLLPPDAAATMAALGTDEAVVGETAAATRTLAVGDRFAIGLGRSRTVRAVLPDALVGGADAVVSTASAEARALTTRFLIVEYDGERAELEAGLREYAPGVPMRFRSPNETRVFRHGDAVLPLAEVEARFGPLTYRDEAGGRLSIDRAWMADHLAVRTVPDLGEIRCHRDVLDDVTAALDTVSGAARATVAGGPAVCFDPHRGEPGLGPSRHAYGIAIAFSLRGEIAPEVVDAFEEHGFTWGGRWLDPEPTRFEWVGR